MSLAASKRSRPSLLWAVFVVLILSVLAWQQQKNAGPDFTESFAPASELAKVLFINDGDTITVDYQGRKTRVRLLGIDTPETEHSAGLARAARRKGHSIETEAKLGDEARQYLQGLLALESSIRLEFEDNAPRYDQYQRLLAYVYLADGSMINEIMLEAGMARVYETKDSRLLPRFRNLAHEARQSQAGLWANDGYGP